MAQTGSIDRVPSVRPVKSSDRGTEILSPEGSSVYITEVRADSAAPSFHGNSTPINTITGIPCKMHHSTDDTDSTQIIENKLSQMSTSGTACLPKLEHQDSSDLSDNEQGNLSTCSEDVLLEAGVNIDLDSLTAADGGNAPLELLSQFMVCLAKDEHKAAKLLCEKILEFEPTNTTAMEFVSLINERIKLNEELPSETSSENDDSSEDEVSFVSSGEESSSEESSSCEDKVSSENGGCGHHH